MKIGDLSLSRINRRLRTGIALEIGSLRVAVSCNARGFAPTFQRLYAHTPFHPDPNQGLIDFPVALRRQGGLRRLVAPQVALYSDQQHPFHPFPEDHAFPFFEWGINWYVATQAHQYLLLHAAVVEKAGKALIMPARPGSGKSTLCAALIHRGWRLLSDEFGLVADEGRSVLALPRPAALKNESIEILSRFAPEAVIGPVFPRTRKGAVAHVMPPRESTEQAGQAAAPGWVVFPQYKAGVTTRLHPFPKGRAFLKLSGNSFNYKLKGPSGFRAVARIVHASHTYFLEFDSLEHAAEMLDRMVEVTTATREE